VLYNQRLRLCTAGELGFSYQKARNSSLNSRDCGGAFGLADELWPHASLKKH